MSMVKYILAIGFSLWFFIILLMPKQELYYKLEEMLQTKEIILNENQINESLFGLSLNNVNIYVKGIAMANIEDITLSTWLFYTKVEVRGIHIDDSLKSILPQEAKEATLMYTVFDPFSISLEAVGSFGAMEGSIDLNENKVHLDFNESTNLEMLKPQLKKAEKGWIYETSF